MSILSRTPAPEPTLDERTARAAAKAGAALSLFEVAAYDLETAAAEHADVAATSRAKAEEHSLRALSADEAAEQAVSQARRIRELIGA